MKFIVASGGTGGHIYPAVSVAIEAKKAVNEVVFLIGGSKIPAERFTNWLEEHRIPVVWIPAERHPLSLLKGFLKTALTLPDVAAGGRTAVIAAGSYAVAPVLSAAVLNAIPIYLLEQNMVPGKVIRFYSRFARCVFSEFPLKRRRFVHSGNPLRPMPLLDKTAARRKLGLPEERFIVLVLGGSQASSKLAELAVQIAKSMRDVTFVVQTGGKIPHIGPENVVFKEFIHEIWLYYSAADLLVARAGGGTIAEAALFGLPAILIPYPLASESHQLHNARFMEKSGAAVVMEEHQLTPQSLAEAIRGLMSDQDRLKAMSEAMRSFARPGAADFIVKSVMAGARCP